MSLRLRLLNLYLRRVQKPALARSADPVRARARFERTTRLLLHAPRGSRIVRSTVGGVPALRVSAKGAADRTCLLYLHGGAFVMGSGRTHAPFAATLSALTGAAVVLPEYRCAPEHPFPCALDDVTAAWDGLLAEGWAPSDILLGGDSAGANLALALLASLCAAGREGPLATFVFSPFTDFRDAGGSRSGNAEADPFLPIAMLSDVRRYYLHGADPSDPRASPVLGRFGGAGPVWLAAGSTEVLLDDMRNMARRLREDGVAVETLVVPDAPHVWPMFGALLPETRQTLASLKRFLSSPVGPPDGS